MTAPLENGRPRGPVRLLLAAYPDAAAADRAARAAVSSGLAACASATGARSHYRWRGRLESVPEVLVLFKTAPKRAGALRAYLRGRHPYELPELLELDTAAADPTYAAWVDRVTGARAEEGAVARLTLRRAGRRGRGARRPARTPARRRRRSR